MFIIAPSLQTQTQNFLNTTGITSNKDLLTYVKKTGETTSAEFKAERQALKQVEKEKKLAKEAEKKTKHLSNKKEKGFFTELAKCLGISSSTKKKSKKKNKDKVEEKTIGTLTLQTPAAAALSTGKVVSSTDGDVMEIVNTTEVTVVEPQSTSIVVTLGTADEVESIANAERTSGIMPVPTTVTTGEIIGNPNAPVEISASSSRVEVVIEPQGSNTEPLEGPMQHALRNAKRGNAPRGK